MGQNIFQSGFGSFQSVGSASVEEIMTIPGYDDPDKAQKLIDDAKEVVAKYVKEGIPVPTAPSASKDSKTSGSAKELADARLKAELQKLDAQDSKESATPAKTEQE